MLSYTKSKSSVKTEPLEYYYLKSDLRCFNTVFWRPYPSDIFQSLCDCYKIFTSDFILIEICQNALLGKIDITMTTINEKLDKSQIGHLH